VIKKQISVEAKQTFTNRSKTAQNITAVFNGLYTGEIQQSFVIYALGMVLQIVKLIFLSMLTEFHYICNIICLQTRLGSLSVNTMGFGNFHYTHVKKPAVEGGTLGNWGTTINDFAWPLKERFSLDMSGLSAFGA
jgi:hypothetical protein